LTGTLVGAVALAIGVLPAPGLAQSDHLPARPMATTGVRACTAPTSATRGPSVGAPPTFAFGKPAEVLLVVPGGYVVRQAMPLEDAIAHATYVSRQIGQPIAVTIPDPAGGPARVEYVGTSGGDVGR
jgi:hypothetical protein